MNNSKLIRNLLLLSLAALVGVWFFRGGSINSLMQKISRFSGKSASQASLTDFEWKPVEVRDIHQTVLATGTITLKTGAEVKIGARISGQLKELNVQIGDFVKSGALIAKIEHDDLLARVTRRQAELSSEEAQLAKTRAEGPLGINKAQAEIEELLAQLKLAKKMLERNTELRDQGVISATVLDQSVEDLDVLRAKIKVAEEELKLREARFPHDVHLADADVAKAQATLFEEETQLSYANITAPIDGVVAFISTQKGETVVASLNAPTFVTLIDLRKLEATVYVDETDIGRVAVGQEAVFTVDSYSDRFFKGVVREIRPKAVIKDNVVNYEVIMDIEQKLLSLLRPEMTANVILTTGVHPQVLSIPKGALKRTDKESFVMLRLGDKIVEKAVETGWREGAFWEILSGLKKDDAVGVPVKKKSEKGQRKKRG